MIVAPADGYALGDYASSVSDGNSLEIPFWRPKDQEGVSTDFYRFVYTVEGTSVASILLKDESVLAGIARDGSWRNSAKEWTPEELSDYLDKHLKVEHLGTTPLRRLTYDHPDPEFAAAFLRKVHLVADQLIRRDRRQVSAEVLNVGDMTLDTATLRLTRAGQELTVSPIGLKLLAILMRESPRVVSRRDIEREIWGDMLPDSDTLRSHLYNLRRVIDKPFARPLLHTIHSAGYRLADLDAEVASAAHMA